MGSNLRRVLNAFVSTPNDPFPNPELYFADLAGFLYRFKNIVIIIQIIMLDALLASATLVFKKRFLIRVDDLDIPLLYNMG